MLSWRNWDTCLPAGRRAVLPITMTQFYVYAIKSLNNNYVYIGLTSNLEKRLKEHNRGKTKSNNSYRPFKLIFSKTFSSRTDPRNAERKLKQGSGREFLKRLLLE